MKNALLTALTLLGLSAFAPRAEAGGWFRVSDRYDRCERPVYYYPSRSRCYPAPTYYRSYPVSSYSYRRPTYYRRDCDSDRRGYYSTPRLSIRFGF